MDIFLTVLAYTLPSVVMLIAVLLIFQKMLKSEQDRRRLELSKQNANQLTPMRLRAYERLVLLLERTQPNAILMRQQLNNTNCLQLQATMLKQIREEFEHNVAQQLYVSREAWGLVCSAKESLLKLTNLSAAQFSTEEAAIKMAEFMIKAYGETQNTPSKIAIDFLRNEIKSEF